MALCASFVACRPPEKKAEAPAAPAKVDKIQQEGELNKVLLTAEAEQRLGIKLAAIEKNSVRRVHSYGGEITLPPGAISSV